MLSLNLLLDEVVLVVLGVVGSFVFLSLGSMGCFTSSLLAIAWNGCHWPLLLLIDVSIGVHRLLGFEVSVT